MSAHGLCVFLSIRIGSLNEALNLFFRAYLFCISGVRGSIGVTVMLSGTWLMV
jgi:hypothetical protein